MLLETLIAVPLPSKEVVSLPTTPGRAIRNFLFEGAFKDRYEIPGISPASALANLYRALKAVDPEGRCTMDAGTSECLDALELSKPLPDLSEIPEDWQHGLADGTVRFVGRTDRLEFTLSGRLLTRVRFGEPALRLVLRAVYRGLFPDGRNVSTGPLVSPSEPLPEPLEAPLPEPPGGTSQKPSTNTVADTSADKGSGTPADASQDMTANTSPEPDAETDAETDSETPAAPSPESSADAEPDAPQLLLRTKPLVDPKFEEDLFDSLSRGRALARLRALLLKEGDSLAGALIAQLEDIVAAPPDTLSRVLVLNTVEGLEGVVRGFSARALRSLVGVGLAFDRLRPALDPVYRLTADGQLLVWRGQSAAFVAEEQHEV